jgi:protein-tyrosine phosphatase
MNILEADQITKSKNDFHATNLNFEASCNSNGENNDIDFEYKKLRKLLLNDFDNSLFFDYNNYGWSSSTNKINIIGIKNPNYYHTQISNYNYTTQKYEYNKNAVNILLGINNIYIICEKSKYVKKYNDLKNIPDYILSYCKEKNMEPIIINCDLNHFGSLYPDLIDNKFTDHSDHFSYANSLKGEIYEKTCRCEKLVGANILPNLIVGQSFDFEYNYEKNEFAKYYNETIQNLKFENVNTIINVYKSHDKIYPPDSINILKKHNIDVYSFPLDENKENDEQNEKNFFDAIDKVNEEINNNKKIYLHCYVGKNRSMSVAIGYMVKYLKIPLKIACEEAYLKKTYATQIKFMSLIWKEAKLIESDPIALCKIIADASNIGNSYSLYGLGFYDVHKLDVIAGRKVVPLINDYKKVMKYLSQQNESTTLDVSVAFNILDTDILDHSCVVS